MTTLTGARETLTGWEDEAQPRRFRPTVSWAVVGGLFLALQLYIYGSWLTSGDVKRTPGGDDEVPGWMAAVAHAWEIGGLFLAATFVYFVVIRPWRREGRFPLDGWFTLAFLSIYWQDMLMNYTQHWITQNTVFWSQFGSWNAEVPGWMAPNGNLIVEPLLLVPGQYMYLLFGGVVGGCWVMRKAKERWPQLGTGGLIAVAYGTFLIGDLLVEPFLMRLGLFAYPGAIKSLTIFAGEYYQFPLYEPPLFAITLAAFAAIRFFKNDKGQTFAERGIDEVRTTERRRGWVRGLALVGIVNSIYLFTYMVPVQWFALNADPWPEEITENRSYLTDGLCGPNTSYACSGPDVPIPRDDSAHVGPDGQLVPAGGDEADDDG